MFDFLSNDSNGAQTNKASEIYNWCEQIARAIDTLLAGLKLKGRCSLVDRLEENRNLLEFLCGSFSSNATDEQINDMKTNLQNIVSETNSKTGTLKKK